MRKKINMEKLILKIKGLGEWEVINHNPETKYVQVQGEEASGNKVRLWIPEAMALTISSMEELRKKKESMRKTADYFKSERNELQKRNVDLSKTIDELKRKNIDLEESLGVLNYMNDDISEEIQEKFHQHRVTTTILGFIAVMEAVFFVAFYLIMQK